MTRYDESFEGVDEPSSALPAGTYDAEVDKTEWKTSEKSQERYIKFTLRITDPDFEGRKVFYNASMAPGAKPYTRQRLSTILGYPVDANFSFDDEDNDALGRPVRVKLAQREYDGRTQNEVKDILAPSFVPAHIGPSETKEDSASGAGPVRRSRLNVDG